MPYLHLRLLSLTILLCITSHTVESTCHMSDDVCEFFLEVQYSLTMRLMGGPFPVLVYPHEGKLYRYDVTNTSEADPVPPETVITADGWTVPRLVIAVNGTVPGPDIIVYQGQKIVVYVKNNLISETTSMHWHGMLMRGTPWMDGVPFITQCPILPGQTFKYEFSVPQTGTYFYHSHSGGQNTMGAHGALIVREKVPLEIEEHILLLTDWDHNHDTDTAVLQILGYYDDRQLLPLQFSIDNAPFVVRRLSSLINGRGRYHDPVEGSNHAPLTVFEVESGKRYRFRVIANSHIHGYRVSVDNHLLKMISSDGRDIEPIEVESFIITPGERFDFEIVADQEIGNYWIRASSLIRGIDIPAEAILRYKGALDKDPVTMRQQCSQDNICVVINCPFETFPEPFIQCLSFNDIKSRSTSDPAPSVINGKFHEYFINFGIPHDHASSNGRVFKVPNVNLLTQSHEWNSPCEPSSCSDTICKCTYSIDIDSGDTIQLVLLNMGIGKFLGHPMHMHGHAFYVLKTGFGPFNASSHLPAADNKDIDCQAGTDQATSLCNNATWANQTWKEGRIPGLELERPPRKDTIFVPSGGYVVVRIRADNPGIWDMHCHIEHHNMLGMRLVFNESFSSIPKPPENFPECHPFPRQRGSSNTYSDDTTSTPGAQFKQEDEEETIPRNVFWIVFGVLIAIIFIQFLVLVAMSVVSRRRSYSSNISGKSNGAFVAQ